MRKEQISISVLPSEKEFLRDFARDKERSVSDAMRLILRSFMANSKSKKQSV